MKPSGEAVPVLELVLGCVKLELASNIFDGHTVALNMLRICRVLASSTSFELPSRHTAPLQLLRLHAPRTPLQHTLKPVIIMYESFLNGAKLGIYWTLESLRSSNRSRLTKDLNAGSSVILLRPANVMHFKLDSPWKEGSFSSNGWRPRWIAVSWCIPENRFCGSFARFVALGVPAMCLNIQARASERVSDRAL